MAKIVWFKRRRNRAGLFQANHSTVYQKKEDALEIQRLQGDVLGNVLAPRSGFYQTKRFHELHGDKSEVVFGFMVAEPQEAWIVVMIILQAGAKCGGYR